MLREIELGHRGGSPLRWIWNTTAVGCKIECFWAVRWISKNSAPRIHRERCNFDKNGVRGVNFEIILPVFAYFLWFVQLQMHIWRFNRNSCNYRFIHQWKSLVVQKQCWKSWKIRTKPHLLIILCGGKMFQKVVKSTLLHRWRCKIDEYRGGGGIHRVYTTAVP